MDKFYGPVTFVTTVETAPGVWRQVTEIRNYAGELLRNVRRWNTNNSVNGDADINNQISILADSYAFEHFHEIRSVRFMGVEWQVTTVEPRYPRLILNVGGLYNGEQT